MDASARTCPTWSSTGTRSSSRSSTAAIRISSAKIQKDFGFAKATTDWHDVIAEKPDIVVVGSPPGYHWEQSKAALEAGAHVMCEKPFTIDPAHAWDLDETARRTGNVADPVVRLELPADGRSRRTG